MDKVEQVGILARVVLTHYLQIGLYLLAEAVAADLIQ